MMSSEENVSNEELSLLKKQMMSLKPVRVEKSSGSSNKDEVKELREQVRELKEVVLEMAYLPDEIHRLRETIQDLEEEQQNNTRRTKKGAVDPDDFEYLQHDVEKLHANMKKQRGELVRNLEGAFTKIDEQKEIIQGQQREIDGLKKEIKWVSMKATEAEKEAKKNRSVSSALENKTVPKKETQSPAKTVSNETQSPSKTVPNGTQSHPKTVTKEAPAPTPSPPPVTRRWRPPARKPESPKKESKLPVWANRAATLKPIIPESDSPRATQKPTIDVHESDSEESDAEAAPSLPRAPPLKTRDDSDSDDSDKPNKTSSQGSDSDSNNKEPETTAPRTHRRNPRKFESTRKPATQNVVDDEDDDDSHEGDGSIEIDVTVDTPEEPPQRAGGRMARRGSLESVQTVDTADTKPKKKSISLLPHKSADIFEQQRKDAVLRRLLMKGKTPNMTVRQVHGKSLVFFSDRVYIPATLREKTLEFYWKKYRKNQTPLLHLEKNCFWADMQNDFKRFENDKRGARVELRVTAARTISH